MSNHIIRSRILQKRLRRLERKRNFSLRLTPLVDVFIILLVFLLKNFSATPDVSLLAKDFLLPISTADKSLEMSTTITATEQAILINGEFTDTTENLSNQKELFNEKVYNKLLQNKEKTLLIAKHNPHVHFQGKIIIQADKRIPYKVIKRLMYTCGQAEFGRIALHVLKKET
ncbi:MAG: biopolymer transporter ExbD [Pseudomonadota bacterium]